MRLKRLDFFHSDEKCNGRVIVSLLILAEGFELWVEGICEECFTHIRVKTPLENLIALTPNPQNKPFFKPPIRKNVELLPEDLDFLRNIGVDPDEKKRREEN